MKKGIFSLISAIILAIVVYYLTASDQTYKVEIAERNPFEASNEKLISKISITQGEKSTILKKTNNLWQVETHAYPAEKELISGFISTLSKSTILDVSSTNPEKEEIFGLGKNGVKVRIHSADNRLHSFEIGKSCAGNTSCYLRFSDKPEVLLTDKNLADLASANPDHWIRKILFSLNRGKIKSLSVKHDTRELEIEQNPSWKMLKPEPFDLDSTEVDALLLSTEKFAVKGIADIQKEQLGKAYVSYSIKSFSGIDHTISFWEKENSDYYVTFNNDSHVFLAPYYKRDTILKHWHSLVKTKKIQNSTK